MTHSSDDARNSDLRYASEAQITGYFGIDPAQLAAWVDAGQLRRRLVRGRWHYAIADVAQLLGVDLAADRSASRAPAPAAAGDAVVVLRRERDLARREHGRAATLVRTWSHEAQRESKRNAALEEQLKRLQAELAAQNHQAAYWQHESGRYRAEVGQLVGASAQLQRDLQSARAAAEGHMQAKLALSEQLVREREQWKTAWRAARRRQLKQLAYALLAGLILGYGVALMMFS